MSDCLVCFEKLNLTTHKNIECLYCGYQACHKCVEKFLVENTIRPKCMSCKTEWNTEFLREKMSKTFMNKSYREHQKDVLFSEIESRTDALQEIIQFRAECRRRWVEIFAAREKARRMEEEYEAFARRERAKPAERTARPSGMPCLSDGCRGRMSADYECGLCEASFCSKCHLLSEADDHECKKEDVETVALLRQNTKPCPKCSMGIYKVDGCDQMWCTSCHTCFSWRSGNILNGPIHNPHFYEFARRNGILQRQPGDIPCGGFPTVFQLETTLERVRSNIRSRTDDRATLGIIEKNLRHASNMMRVGIHIQESTMPSIRHRLDGRARRDDEAGISYLVKKIDRKTLGVMLYKDARKEEKFRRYYQILETLTTNLAELLRQFVSGENTLEACAALYQYSGQEIEKINKQYNCKLPIITPSIDTGRIERLLR